MMYRSPYTVFLSGIDNEYDYIKVNYIKEAAQLWADEMDAVIIDDNGVRVDVEDIKAVLGW